MAGDRVSLTLGDVRHAVDLLCVCTIGAIDSPLKRAGEASRVAVFDAVEHDLVTTYELVDVYAQMSRAGMANELSR